MSAKFSNVYEVRLRFPAASWTGAQRTARVIQRALRLACEVMALRVVRVQGKGGR